MASFDKAAAHLKETESHDGRMNECTGQAIYFVFIYLHDAWFTGHIQITIGQQRRSK